MRAEQVGGEGDAEKTDQVSGDQAGADGERAANDGAFDGASEAALTGTAGGVF